MKLEDIKKEMPKTPEMIHNRIQDEIKKQMKMSRLRYFQQKMLRKQNGAELVWQQSPQFVF